MIGSLDNGDGWDVETCLIATLSLIVPDACVNAIVKKRLCVAD